MGLDRDFLSMLNASVTLERRAGTDAWGNEAFGAPEAQRAFIDGVMASYGTGEEGKQKSDRVVHSSEIMMDGIGVKPDDRITISTEKYVVTGVQTSKDEFGADLYQTVTVENQ